MATGQYIISKSAGLTWTQASQRAAALGGQLASLSTPAENNLILNALSASGNVFFSASSSYPGQLFGPWIGLYYVAGVEPRGGFKWLDGSPLLPAGFHPTEPSGALSDNAGIFYRFNGSTGWGIHPNDPLPRNYPATTSSVVELPASRKNLNGTAGIDYIIGSNVANAIDGKAGADWMQGGKGNDVYFADSTRDIVYEVLREGTDTVYAAASFALAAGQEVEVLRTNKDAGRASIDLSGNDFANTLIGNAGDNVLNGGGGADILRGGAGVDTASYAGGSARLIVSLGNPASNRGDARGDTFSFIENLAGSRFGDRLTGDKGDNTLSGGAGGDRLAGGAGGDTLFGGKGNDRLSGGSGDDTLSGGPGKDVLSGNTGDDVFLFDTGLRKSVDRVVDFSRADDSIQLDDDVFGRAGVVPISDADGKIGLARGAFWVNTTGKAHDRSDRIIYDRTDGHLYYDVDGSGPRKGVQFADLASKLRLTANDFEIVA